MEVRRQLSKRGGDSVAVAIGRDKGSIYAFQWVVNHIVKPGQTLTLLQVKQPGAPAPPNQRRMVHGSEVAQEVAEIYKNQPDAQAKEWLLPMHSVCIKKKRTCNEVILEHSDIPKPLINYVAANSIEVLVLSVTSKSGFFRFKAKDIPSTVLKRAPKFCAVYVIGRDKISSMRYATSALPQKPKEFDTELEEDTIFQMSSRKQGLGRTFAFSPRHPAYSESDRSPTSSSDSGWTSYSGTEYIDMTYPQSEVSSFSTESGRLSASQNMDEVEAEIRRLQSDLKQTMDMYGTACKEAVTEKNKAKELNQWKLEKEHQLEEARLAEETALKLADIEREKCRVAIKEAEAAQRLDKLEAQKARVAEMKALEQPGDGQKVSEAMTYSLRSCKYTIEELEAATNDFSPARKIGKGARGYGPVFLGELDHTQVAIKVLRPDAAQGGLQFQNEVDILSCIWHPNMVLLLGACSEYGCLVYEYMANGSLEDCLFRRSNTPVIPWQLRFRIAAEICTGLFFLHQTKPEPLVHRDLNPGTILLDHNYVSKISDVGLARLVPQEVADSVTQFHMTSTAGTFSYVDPEYQQTGMLVTKPDIYSLGVILLQLITAKPPMGLTHYVQKAIDKGNFAQILDPDVPDWPVEEALKFAKLGLQCAEIRRKNRPDLGKIVLPELNRPSALAEDSMNSIMHSRGGRGVKKPRPRPRPSLTIKDVLNGIHLS